MQMVYDLNKEEKVFFELLVAAVHHTEFSGVSLNEEEWKKVFQLAGKHNVLPLIFEKAAETEGFMEMFGNSPVMMKVVASVSKQAQRTENFLQLYQKLQEVGVSPIVMKGIICRQLYGEYCNHRPSGDEDILIRKEEYAMVKKVFIENGYIPEAKFENISEEDLETVREIAFKNRNTQLVVEVHLNPTGRESEVKNKITSYFQDAFDRSRTVCIDGVSITTMNDTDHYLFLIFHAFLHFSAAGMGIRQMLDILLYGEKYHSSIDWENVRTVLEDVRAEGFYSDLLIIGNHLLGFDFPAFGSERCPEELLRDLLGNGVFGNGTMEQRLAAQIVVESVLRDTDSNEGKLKRIFYILFRNKNWMLKYYPEVAKKPWLIPVRWVQRWGRFFVRNKSDAKKLAFKSMEISDRRIALLEKYDIV